MDEDTTDAAWAQLQLEEQEQWERHARVSREFQAWARAEGFLPKLKTTRNEHEISSENDF